MKNAIKVKVEKVERGFIVAFASDDFTGMIGEQYVALGREDLSQVLEQEVMKRVRKIVDDVASEPPASPNT